MTSRLSPSTSAPRLADVRPGIARRERSAPAATLSPSVGLPRLEEIQPGIPVRARPSPAAPLMPMAVGWMVGIAANEYLGLSSYVSSTLVTVGALGAIRFRSVRFAGTPALIRASLIRASLILAAIGLGALRHELAESVPADHVFRFTSTEPALVTVRGRVLRRPEIVEPSPDEPRACEAGPKTRFLLEAEPKTRFLLEAGQIAGKRGPIPVSGWVTTTIKAPVLGLDAGDEIEMTGWLYRPRGPMNPGEYDRAKALRRSGILAGFSCAHAESVRWIERRAGGGFGRWVADLQTRMRAYLVEEAFDDEDAGAGVMSAMVLGLRSEVPRAMNEAFIRTGNAHFLAASGMNVAWLAMVVWWMARIAGLHYRPTALVVGGVIAVYILLAEPQPSIWRAGIIGVLGSLSVFLRGRAAVMNWLSLAAIVILMITPGDLFRPAFQYTFLAVMALVVLEPRAAGALAGWALHRNWIGLARRLGSGGQLFGLTLFDASIAHAGNALMGERGEWSVREVLASGLVRLTTLSMAAWLLVTPLAIYQFDQFTPWGWFGTLAVWIIAMPVTCIGFVTAMAAVIFPSSAKLLGPILGAGTDLLIGWVELLGKIPFTQLNGGLPSVWWVGAVYAALAVWLWWPQGRKPVPRWGFRIAACLLLVWWLVPQRGLRADGRALQVWMLAVGDGAGTVIELPNGRVLIYDVGTRSPLQAGRVCESFLRYRGISEVDTVFVSHADFDHYSGVAEIARKFRVGRIVVNDHFQRFTPVKSAVGDFLGAMQLLEVPLQVMSGPGRVEGTGDVVVEAVWPPPRDEKAIQECNDASMVLRLTYEGRSILLTGDIAQSAMAELLRGGDRHPGVPVDVLKADALALPHHGSVVHNTDEFISAVGPRIAVRSTGQRRSLTVNGIEKLVGPAEYLSTADDGCILVRIKGGVITARAIMKAP